MKRHDHISVYRETGLSFPFSSFGKLALSFALLGSSVLAPAAAVRANPTDGVVQGGSATISESGNTLTVNQNSDRVVIDWRSFDIDADELTQFIQPNSSSIALNRVTSGDPSEILGTLSANGNVILINPNGVFFGAGSVVDVNGLIATSADIDTDDFMGGSNDFNIVGSSDAQIINHGTITAADAGLVGLVAPHVENHGIIQAKLGRVHLASGDTVVADFYGDGLLQVALKDEEVTQQIVLNDGTISAQGGMVAMTAAAARQSIDALVRAEGEISTASVTQQGGVIMIGADSGTTEIAGSLDARGTSGGEILIGGDYQGSGDMATSANTVVEESALIQANAGTDGDGGKVIVWADDSTVMAGTIEAKGGSQSGDGGFVETSGKLNLAVYGSVDASATYGSGGQWLLDPSNVTISASTGDSISSSGGTVNPSSDGYVILASSIQDALNNGNSVTITTTNGSGTDDGNITTSGVVNISKTSGGDATLTLEAYKNIDLTDLTITSSSGALSVILNSDTSGNSSGYINLEDSSFTTNGGDFIAGGGADPYTTAAYGNEDYSTGVRMVSTSISTDAGNISLIGHGKNASGEDSRHGLTIGTNSSLTSTTGTITLNGTSGIGWRYSRGVIISGASTITSAYGDISITGTGQTYNGTGNLNEGIRLIGGAVISSTGTGDNAASITLNGSGGNGSGTNYGVSIGEAGTAITSIDGNISITGTGGSNGNSNQNYGIYIYDGAQLTSTGDDANAATITLNGTGADGEGSNYGLYLTGTDTLISSSYGDISITGTGGSNGTSGSNAGHGIRIDDGAQIISDGEGEDAATITLVGNTGDGDGYNFGIVIANSGSLITSEDGDISITGTSSSNVIGSNNEGIRLISGADITSTGTSEYAATITLDGTGGTGVSGNHGVNIGQSGTLITSVYGDILITGQGGSDGSGDDNYGIYINNDADITSTGTAANAATITLNGTGGDGGQTNHGLYISDSGTTITSAYGNISLIGSGGSNGSGDDNYGIYMLNSAQITSTGDDENAATITLDGTGGDGLTTNYGIFAENSGTAISSAYGDISITAQGGGNSSSSSQANYGIRFADSFALSSTGVEADAAQITINATGGNNKQINYGFVATSNTLITSIDGDISITGTGGSDGSGADNSGIYILAGSDIISTGTSEYAAKITLVGTGGDGTSTNYGVHITSSGTIISSAYGDISITGNGGSDGSGDDNYGIYLQNGADIISTGTDANAATITLNGTGGAGRDTNYGIFGEDAGTAITSAYGDILLIGQGGTSGAYASNGAYGMRFADSFVISSTGVGADAAKITLNATAGEARAADYGLVLTANTLIKSGYGDIAITGTGATSSSLVGNTNYGIYITGSSDIISTGTGQYAADITLIGRGASGTADNYGISVATSGTTITSIDGDITLTGYGGGSEAVSNVSGGTGVSVSNNADITSSGAGNITLTGYAAENSNANSDGVRVYHSGTTVTVAEGNLTISGTTYGTSATDDGFLLSESALLSSSGAGDISITALNLGNTGYASRLLTYADIIHSGTGSLLFTTNAGSVLEISDNGTTLSTTSGDIKLTADYLNLLSSATISSAGDLYIDTVSTDHTIGLGGASGDLNLDDSELALLSAGGNLIIGSAGTAGAMNMQSVDVTGGNYGLSLYGDSLTVTGGLDLDGALYANIGGDISLGGTVVVGGRTSLYGQNLTIGGALSSGGALLADIGNNITLNNTVSSDATGTSVVFAAGNRFTNRAGSNAINAGNGRWLVYGQNPDLVNLGNLKTTFKVFERSYAQYSPAHVAYNGNGVIYQNALTESLNQTVDLQSTLTTATINTNVAVETPSTQSSIPEYGSASSNTSQGNNDTFGQIDSANGLEASFGSAGVNFRISKPLAAFLQETR